MYFVLLEGTGLGFLANLVDFLIVKTVHSISETPFISCSRLQPEISVFGTPGCLLWTILQLIGAPEATQSTDCVSSYIFLFKLSKR